MTRSSSSSMSSSNRASISKTSQAHRGIRPYFDKSKEGALARATYLKVLGGGSFATIVLIFAVFSIFWGALWKIPARNLQGWVVDFDGGLIGKTVSQALAAPSTTSKVTWSVVPAANFPGGAAEVRALVLDQHTWVAITINEGASSRLSTSLITPNASYDGSEALTVFGVEARNENAFRNLIRPSAQASLEAITKAIAIQTAQKIANSTNLASVLTVSPQTLVTPVSYRIVNLAPFDVPVATAVTFVGLIYQLILSFFVVMITNAAREASGLGRTLPTRSLIILRLVSTFVVYLAISLFYCLLSVAFQLPLSHKFGHSGFLIFWMLNYCNMLACGLALESLMTLLTVKGIPFFMLTWIIANVSVCIFPIEVMPEIFRYGYAAPFYNVSRAMRTIVFGTKNMVGESFGIIIAWIVISCITLPLIQWHVRRKANASLNSATEDSNLDSPPLEDEPRKSTTKEIV